MWHLAVIATAGVLVHRGADMGKAKIGKLGGTTGIQQNVEAFDVSVDDIVGVQKVQSLHIFGRKGSSKSGDSGEGNGKGKLRAESPGTYAREHT